jgi:hypothetical protein
MSEAPEEEFLVDRWEREHGRPHPQGAYHREVRDAHIANERAAEKRRRQEEERLSRMPPPLILTNEERRANLKDRLNALRPRREPPPPPQAADLTDILLEMRPRNGPPRPASDFNPMLEGYPAVLELLRTHTESPSSDSSESPVKGVPPPGLEDSPLKSKRIDFEEEEEFDGGGPPPGDPEEEDPAE